MTTESPTSRKKEPSNLLLFVLFVLLLLLIYLVYRPEGHQHLQPREATLTVQTVSQTAQPNPYLTASGQLKPRISIDPIESKLMDILDPGVFAMMEVSPSMGVTFDQDMHVVVAFRTAQGKWSIQWIKQRSVLDTGNATYMMYWTFPATLGNHSIEKRYDAAVQYLLDSGVLQ